LAEPSKYGTAISSEPRTVARSPAIVAAADYSPHSGAYSEFVGESGASIPARGWTSAAGWIQGEATLAVDARPRRCQLCFAPDHFLMYCPLLGEDVKQAAQRQRDLRRDAPAARVTTTPTPPPMASNFLARPPGPPRYGEPRRVPSGAYHVEDVQDNPESDDPRSRAPSAENDEGGAQRRAFSLFRWSRFRIYLLAHFPSSEKSTEQRASVFQLRTRDYKVSAAVGVTTLMATSTRAILDTGGAEPHSRGSRTAGLEALPRP
jgi:hypothetical protein